MYNLHKNNKNIGKFIYIAFSEMVIDICHLMCIINYDNENK